MVDLVTRPIITVLIFAAALVIEPGQALAEDFLDRLMKSCSEGDKKACAELDALAKKLEPQLERLNAQADQFQVDAKGLGLQTGTRPNLEKAYPIILHRYMSSDTVEPIHRKRGLDKKLILLCSKNFNDLFFVHGRKIGFLPSGEPDWAEIYLQTIDHYFRYCSRRGGT